MIKRLLTSLLLVCAGTAAAQCTSAAPCTMTLNEAGSTYPSAALGIDIQTGDYYANFYDNNLLQTLAPSLAGTQFRLVEHNIAAATSTTFTSNNPYDQIPAGFANGWTFVVQAHSGSTSTGAAGCTGTITSNTAGNYSVSGPVFTYSGCSTPIAAGDSVYIKSPDAGVQGNSQFEWTVSGAGTVTMDTNLAHMPAAFSILPQPTSAALIVNTGSQQSTLTAYIDAVGSVNNYYFQGGYKQSVNVNVLSGTGCQVQMQTQRNGQISLNGTQNVAGGWNTYTVTGTGTESASTPAQAVAVSYVFTGACSFVVDGLALYATTHTNPSTLSDEMMANLVGTKAKRLRYNLISSDAGSSGGCTVDNLMQPQDRRQPCVANVVSGSAAYIHGYNQSTAMSIPEFYEACKAAGMTGCQYALPTTWSNADYLNYESYMSDDCFTGYGQVRCAYGDIVPWNQVFADIVNAVGNETWNGTTSGLYYGDYPFTNYLPVARDICAVLESAPHYNAAVEHCSADVQQVYGSRNSDAIKAVDGPTHPHINLQDSSLYYQVGTNTSCNPSTWVRDAVAEVWGDSFDANLGVQQTGASGLPTSGYESNWGSVLGVCDTTTVLQTQAGEGSGLVSLMTSMRLQKTFPGQFIRQNRFTIMGDKAPYSSNASVNPATLAPIWGVMRQGTGALKKFRPEYFSDALFSGCSYLGTGYPVTLSAVPTFNHAASNGIAAYSGVPLVDATAYTKGANRCLLLANADSVDHYYNLAGTNLPSGPVTETTYGSANVSDTNETTQNVSNAVTTITSPTQVVVPAFGAVSLAYSTASAPAATKFTLNGAIVLSGTIAVQ